MVKVKSEQLHGDMREAIKNLARQQMAAEGSAAISLRGIARDMHVTAPALYRYFPSRDHLITGLIADGYNAIADTLEQVNAGLAADAYAERLFAVLMAYRAWALEHPTDFALLYGTPIPGYEAPREVTVPAATRTFALIVGIIAEAMGAGVLTETPEQRALPPSIAAHLTQMGASEGYTVPESALYLGVVGWARLHGIIMLELFNHIQPVIGDTDAFYRAELLGLLNSSGLHLST